MSIPGFSAHDSSNNLIVQYAGKLLAEVRQGKDPVDTAKKIAEEFYMKLPQGISYEDLLAAAAHMSKNVSSKTQTSVVINPTVDKAIKNCNSKFVYANNKLVAEEDKFSADEKKDLWDIIKDGRDNLLAAGKYAETGDDDLAIEHVLAASFTFGSVIGALSSTE